MRSLLLLPSIVFRVDQLLVMAELNHALFNNQYDLTNLLVATTSVSASADFDYERLELLGESCIKDSDQITHCEIGDAILKFIASTYCYVKEPSAKEGSLHFARQQIVSNRALYAGALEVCLPPFIQSKPLYPKIWQPDYPRGSTSNLSLAEQSIAPAESRSKRQKQKDMLSTQWLPEKARVSLIMEVYVAHDIMT